LERGTKETPTRATRGTAIPSRSSGQAAAAATTADSIVCSLGEVWPNKATTAQPKIALRIFPADLVMRLIRAWRIATCRNLAPGLHSRRAARRASGWARPPAHPLLVRSLREQGIRESLLHAVAAELA